MDNRPVDRIGLAEHLVGVRQTALLQRGTDAGRGYCLTVVLRHRHNMDADAQRFAELPQPFDIAGRPRAEGKVIAAEKLPRRKAVNKHPLHKILR